MTNDPNFDFENPTDDNPPKFPEGPKRRDSNNIWLYVGIGIIAVLASAAALLYFFSPKDSDREYHDGSNEKPLRIHNDEDERPLKKADFEIADTASIEKADIDRPHRLFGQGTNGEASFSLDLNIADNGSLSGTYWNVIYNLQFSVSGKMLDDGTIDMTLTQVKDHTPTPLKLFTSDGYHYHGTWGSSNREVTLTLDSDHTPLYRSGSVIDTWHIQGPDNSKILNADINLCYDRRTESYTMWYRDQGSLNAIPLIENGNGFLVYNYDNTLVAEITLYNDGTGELIYRGSGGSQRFNISPAN